MPIYEYRCDQCGLEKEYLQKISDAPISVCPGCGSGMTKLISAAGFQLKGSGWYVTDFRNSGAKPAAKDKDKDKEKESAKGEAASAPTDGKPGSGDKSEAAAAPSADKPADKPASTERKDGPAAAPASTPPAGN